MVGRLGRPEELKDCGWYTEFLNFNSIFYFFFPAVLQNMICVACNSQLQSDQKGNRLPFSTAPTVI